MFQYLVAELAMGVILSLIPQKVRNVIGGLIMAVGTLLILLGFPVFLFASADLSEILVPVLWIVGLGFLVLGWRMRRAIKTVGEIITSELEDRILY